MAVSSPAPPDIMSPEHVIDPWPGLEVLRDHYPVHFDETLGVWLVSRYEDVRPLGHLPIGDLGQELIGQYFSDAQAFFAMDGHARNIFSPRVKTSDQTSAAPKSANGAFGGPVGTGRCTLIPRL